MSIRIGSMIDLNASSRFSMPVPTERRGTQLVTPVLPINSNLEIHNESEILRNVVEQQKISKN